MVLQGEGTTSGRRCFNTAVNCSGHLLYPTTAYASCRVLPSCRRHQFTSITDWTGGLYISPGFAGSRSGALIATAWASMMHLGEEGFLKITESIMKVCLPFSLNDSMGAFG